MGAKKVFKKAGKEANKFIKKVTKSKTGKEVIRKEKVLVAEMVESKAKEIKKKSKK